MQQSNTDLFKFVKCLINKFIYRMAISGAQVVGAVGGGMLVAFSSIFYFVYFVRRLDLSVTYTSVIYCRKNLIPDALAIIGGMLLAAGICFDWIGYNNFNGVTPYGKQEDIIKRTSVYGYMVGGLLIGVAVRLMRGDFVFHAYSGIGRRSLKSFLIVLIIILFAILSAWLGNSNNIGFLTDQSKNPQAQINHAITANVCIGLSVLFLVIAFFMLRGILDDKQCFKDALAAFFTGFLLSAGLLWSDLTRRVTIFNSLSPDSNWTPILLIFLAVVILVTLLLFEFAVQKGSTLIGDVFGSADDKLTARNGIGAVLFGLGWGIAGLDLATYIIHFAILTIPISCIFGAFIILGIFIGGFLE